jgi:ELWxxDGT repeat protein
LYFIETVGCELWRSDGTAAGTQPVKRFAPTPGPYGGTFCPLQLARSGGKLFLSAAEQPGDVELWVSDGTPAGTQLLKDIRPGEQGSSPLQLTDGYGTLLFAADDGVHGRELWASDGTAAGTRLLADLAPGMQSGSPEALLVAADRLYFSAYDLQAGTELWTVALRDLGLPVNRLYLPIARRW